MSQDNLTNRYCPCCCGAKPLRLIEQVGNHSEWKEILTCDCCEAIIYIVRFKDDNVFTLKVDDKPVLHGPEDEVDPEPFQPI